MIPYTINSLLGLQAAARDDPRTRSGARSRADDDVPRTSRRAIDNPADLGLCSSFSEGEPADAQANELLARWTRRAKHRRERLTMQEASWMLWGACAAAQAGSRPVQRPPMSSPSSSSTGSSIRLRPAAPRSPPLPRRHRLVRRADVLPPRNVRVLAPERGHAAAAGVRARCRRDRRDPGRPRRMALADQRSGSRPARGHPVFAVHQDSMSMLFLLPPLESGMDVREAITKSFAWVRGATSSRRR